MTNYLFIEELRILLKYLDALVEECSSPADICSRSFGRGAILGTQVGSDTLCTLPSDTRFICEEKRKCKRRRVLEAVDMCMWWQYKKRMTEGETRYSGKRK